MFTSEYLKNKERVEKLQIEFNNNPCTKTATKLSKARVELRNTPKHTQEYLDYCDRETIKDMIETVSFVNANDVI